MTNGFDSLDGGPRPVPRRSGAFLIGMVAFLGGLALAVWALSSWPALRDMLAIETGPPPGATAPVQVQPVAAPPASAAPALAPALAASLDGRVSEIELRIDRVAERANAAGANAARAEGLLIAFAARRAIDRGLGLGYIEAELRTRFGAAQPQAVALVIDAARQPVTLEDLQLGLDDLAPALTSGVDSEGWWTALRRELGGLIVIRKAGTPSTGPAERLRHARRLLAGGQVDKAMVEIIRLPGHNEAGNWLAAARRYVRTRQALDILETSAILQPRGPATPPPLLPEPTPAR
ncbi:hypothetical protein GVO57_04335 [Sphingomonas changnyeongensis]|uniref:Inner membrane protein n=1 Tax=Sphingomonas changnyeongensis TaxID=2698679 RepID=A0A7Z2S816_9SPHN|nr:hypothetical protein [Sphingomonas changnyeongensis]QHL90207.1 hypothetical protein GVO57_04335 [Sphingomonas changnyeongensis]